MQTIKPVLFSFVLIAFCHLSSYAQGKWKLGVGMSYVTNDHEVDYVDTYLAPNFSVGYAFLRKSPLSVEVELFNSVKARQESDFDSQFGWVSSLPVLVNLDTRRFNFHAGAGPAFLMHQSRWYNDTKTVTGGFVNYSAGIAFKGNPLLADVIYPAYTVRFSYFRSFKNRAMDAGSLSFILFFKGR
jgi:hypothetical protein